MPHIYLPVELPELDGSHVCRDEGRRELDRRGRVLQQGSPLIAKTWKWHCFFVKCIALKLTRT